MLSNLVELCSIIIFVKKGLRSHLLVKEHKSLIWRKYRLVQFKQLNSQNSSCNFLKQKSLDFRRLGIQTIDTWNRGGTSNDGSF